MATTSIDASLSALERARRVVPIVTKHAAETEIALRVHPASLEATLDEQFFSLPLPDRFGGGGASVTDMVRVQIEIGRGCPSKSWVIGTSATSKNFVSQSFDDNVLTTIFADANSVFCGSGKPSGSATPAPGGFYVSGQWDYISGAEDATYAALGVMLSGDNGLPVFSQAVVLVDDLAVHKTWDAAGLRGTGSHTLSADKVFLPLERVGAVEFRPTFVLTGSAYVLGPVLGAALGALDITQRLFASGANRLGKTYSTLAQSPAAQRLFSEATQLVEDAIDRALARCAALDRDEIIAPVDVARTRSSFASSAKDALAAMERMADLHGTTCERTLERHGRQVIVSITDYGRWRAPASDPGYRGRGLPMMRTLTQHMSVESGVVGTTVRLFSRPVPAVASPPLARLGARHCY